MAANANANARLELGGGGSLYPESMGGGTDEDGVFCEIRNFHRVGGDGDDLPDSHVYALYRLLLVFEVPSGGRSKGVQLLGCDDAHELEDDGWNFL